MVSSISGAPFKGSTIFSCVLGVVGEEINEGLRVAARIGSFVCPIVGDNGTLFWRRINRILRKGGAGKRDKDQNDLAGGSHPKKVHSLAITV